MADIVNLKYRIPNLVFNKKSSQDLTFKLEIKKSTETAYTVVSSNYVTDKEGNNINDVSFSAEDDTLYDVRLTNMLDPSKVFNTTIRTNKTLPIAYSPYKDKILFAGQNRDMFVEGLFLSSLPDLTGGAIMYTYDDNYREAVGNTANMVPSEGTVFKSAIDANDPDRVIKGLYLSGTNYVKFNDVANDYASQIRDVHLFGSGNKSYTIQFLVQFEDGTDKTLLATGNASNNFKIQLVSGKLTVSVTKDGITQTVVGTINAVLNRLYAVRISVKVGGNGTTDNKIWMYYPSNNIQLTGTLNTAPTPQDLPVFIGHDPVTATTTGKFIFSYFYYFPGETIDNIDEWKVTTSWDYKPKIAFQAYSTTVPNPNPVQYIPKEWWLKFDNAQISFVVPPDLPAGEYDHWVEQYNGNKLQVTPKMDVRHATQTGGYDIDLSTGDYNIKLALLKEKYYAFHGQWGGANGGVNAHLVYENPSERTLILEQHGDEYSGNLQGVGKPAKDNTWTGYGVDKIHDIIEDPKYGQPWTTRVGACIVSADYHGYGEYNITMKVPVGSYGYCPAIWLFHYQEIYPSDTRWQYWLNKGAKPYGGADPYMVINHEIDMELPSHLTQGIFASWEELELAYFDPKALDNQFHIAIEDFNTPQNNGLYVLNNVALPNTRSSWNKVSDTWIKLDEPSFANAKFNNWIGEMSSGSGWAYEQQSYDEAEQYLALLTELEQDYADDQFHKWTIKWYKNRTELWIDDVFIRENRAFVPYISGRVTIGGWFPSAVRDDDQTHWDYTPARAWAGHPANFDSLQIELRRIQFIPFNSSVAGGVNELYAESFPETNLRVIA